MPLPEEKSEWKNLNIVFATSKGKIRKNSLEDFININASGKIAMKLDPNDKIIGVKICREDQDIILSSLNGKSIRFNVEKIRLFKGRSSKGIRGINLKENDMHGNFLRKEEMIITWKQNKLPLKPVLPLLNKTSQVPMNATVTEKFSFIRKP